MQIVRERSWRASSALLDRTQRSERPRKMRRGARHAGIGCMQSRAHDLVISGAGPVGALTAHDDDRAYCRHALEEVSRTFSRPIAMLPEPLAKAVGCGYLLCRIVDTIEDHPQLVIAERERMFGTFIDTLHGGDPRLL